MKRSKAGDRASGGENRDRCRNGLHSISATHEREAGKVAASSHVLNHALRVKGLYRKCKAGSGARKD